MRIVSVSIACFWMAQLVAFGAEAAADGEVFTVVANPGGRHAPLASLAKFVDVFGVAVYATDTTADQKVLHAANVLAQYLDGDADGEPDNPAVMRALHERGAGMVMFATQDEARTHPIWDADLPHNIALQDLYGAETHPNGAERGEFDGALEEVLHLVTHEGYANAYPDAFGERVGSTLADAMDKARGGRFIDVPDAYPDDAWYSYDDETCDYGCQVTEYLYWVVTSLLGAQDFDGRPEQIADEWRLPTASAVRERDPDVYRLVSDPVYRFPRRLPDGRYRIKKARRAAAPPATP